MTPKEVLAFAKQNGAKMVDFKFMDFVGTWQHFTNPIDELGESEFENGYGFDGSSIRGWQPIHASDMLIIPDPTTAKMDPFMAVPTLTMICDVVDPVTKESMQEDWEFEIVFAAILGGESATPSAPPQDQPPADFVAE